jgi:hypothetical protein
MVSNFPGMASPLLGIAAQNSLLFTAFQTSKRFVSETPNLTLTQTAAAGAMAGAVNSIMASPVELLKIRMQSQYGGATDQKLRQVASQLWREHGFRRGVMRGFWVSLFNDVVLCHFCLLMLLWCCTYRSLWQERLPHMQLSTEASPCQRNNLESVYIPI